jgi:hypothetical protein
MSSHQVQSAILPAILVSSAVFSLLSFPFFFYRSHSAAVDVSFMGQDLKPILTSQNRNLTIRYVGGSMVLSVATGLVTVELWRRQRAWQKAQQLAAPLANFPDQAEPANWYVSQSELNSDSEPNLKSLSLDQDLDQDWQDEFATSSVSELAPFPELAQTTQTGYQIGQVLELADGATCRIRVKPLQQRQFAIQVAGQFYSFFRLVSTRDAALETARQLSARDHLVVITPVEQRYAVWVWQPEAEIEFVSIVNH